MKPSGPRVLFVGSFLISASILLVVIDPLRFSVLDSVLEDCMFLGIYPLPPDYPTICGHIVVCNIF